MSPKNCAVAGNIFRLSLPQLYEGCRDPVTGFGPDCRGGLIRGCRRGCRFTKRVAHASEGPCCQRRSRTRPCGGTGIYHFDWVTSLSAARMAASLRSTCSCATGVSIFAKLSTLHSMNGSFWCLRKLAGNVRVRVLAEWKGLCIYRRRNS